MCRKSIGPGFIPPGPIFSITIYLVHVVAVPDVIKAKHFEQIPDGRHIGRHIGIVRVHLGIWQVITAAVRKRAQAPIALDELHHGCMVIIGVVHPAASCEGRYRNHWNTGAVAEEVERLKESRIPVAAALVERDQQSSLSEEVRMSAEPIKNLVDHPFEIDEL